jgi:hypothetical protein
VRAHLERTLQSALRELDQVKREVERHDDRPVAVDPDDAQDLLALAGDLPGIWNASTTTNEDRKRLLRMVLSEIVVKGVTDEAIELELGWIGGLREKVTALRPHGVDEVVKELHGLGMSPAAIAEEIRATGITTAQGRPMSRGAMHQKLKRLGLNWKKRRIADLKTIANLVRDGRSCKEIASTLADADSRAGWNYQRVYRAIQLLRRGVPGVGALPATLPIDERRDEVIRIILDGRALNKRFWEIADQLNDTGLRPKKSGKFTGPQVRDLLYEWQGRQEQKVSG